MYYLTKILCILCLIGVTIGNKADYVPLVDVASQSGCLDEKSKVSNLTFHLLPANATLYYIRCFRGPSEVTENWQYVYTFTLDKSGEAGFPSTELKGRISHVWNQGSGTFTLLLLEPTHNDAMWYRCDFSGVHKNKEHRKRESYLEQNYMADRKASGDQYKTENKQTKIKRHIKSLKHVLSHSCCAREGQKETHLTWSVRPRDSKVYYVKCHRRPYINSKEKRQHIYTVRMDNGEARSMRSTLEGRLSHQWNANAGLFSLVIAEPAEEDARMWYYCDFAGNQGKRRSYICLSWTNKVMTTITEVPITMRPTTFHSKIQIQDVRVVDKKLSNSINKLEGASNKGHGIIFQLWSVPIILGIYRIT